MVLSELYGIESGEAKMEQKRKAEEVLSELYGIERKESSSHRGWFRYVLSELYGIESLEDQDSF